MQSLTCSMQNQEHLRPKGALHKMFCGGRFGIFPSYIFDVFLFHSFFFLANFTVDFFISQKSLQYSNFLLVKKITFGN